MYVAPRVGAWIETLLQSNLLDLYSSSHPVWVRGLKLYMRKRCCQLVAVAPRVGAWIETES